MQQVSAPCQLRDVQRGAPSCVSSRASRVWYFSRYATLARSSRFSRSNSCSRVSGFALLRAPLGCPLAWDAAPRRHPRDTHGTICPAVPRWRARSAGQPRARAGPHRHGRAPPPASSRGRMSCCRHACHEPVLPANGKPMDPFSRGMLRNAKRRGEPRGAPALTKQTGDPLHATIVVVPSPIPLHKKTAPPKTRSEYFQSNFRGTVHSLWWPHPPLFIHLLRYSTVTDLAKLRGLSTS